MSDDSCAIEDEARPKKKERMEDKPQDKDLISAARYNTSDRVSIVDNNGSPMAHGYVQDDEPALENLPQEEGSTFMYPLSVCFVCLCSWA